MARAAQIYVGTVSSWLTAELTPAYAALDVKRDTRATSARVSVYETFLEANLCCG